MKKGIITMGVLTALTSTVKTDMAFAENAEYSKSTRDVVQSTGTVNLKASTSLYIRSNPSTSSSIKGKIKGGATVTILEKTNNSWYKVSYNGITGYSSSQYIVLNTSTSQLSNKGRVNTTTSNLNMRKNAKLTSTVVAKLSPGTTVDILDNKTNGWYYVSANGKNGYVKSEYITLISSNSSSTTTQTSNSQSTSTTTTTSDINNGKIATVNATALNVRTGNGLSSSIITRAYSGNTVAILNTESNGWYKVSLSSGVTGWCNGKYLTNFRTGTISTQSSNTLTTNATSKAQAVINIAKSKLGNKYVWGGSGPNNFDCSGLTQYAFKNGANINIPRTSSSQATAGTYVSKSNLQPGDLVFFSNNGKTINHVGLYIGNNQMIHSPKPGDVVKIQRIDTTYYKNAYVTARRVL